MSNQARRIRLKPWLLAQVNGGRYPGLQWLRQEHRLFQIPWRHATRHMPMSEEENTIFKAWALETGKYQEGVDEPDPAKWKANLRCALNKSREFKLVYDGTKETPVKPYKIYEVCDQPSNGGQCASLPVVYPPDKINAKNELPISRKGKRRVLLSFAVQVVRLSSSPQSPAPATCPPSATSTRRWSTTAPRSTAPSAPPTSSRCLCCRTRRSPVTDLDLKFQYRGRTARSQTVSNPQGCRLYYGHLEATLGQVDLFGPVTLQQVLFPGTAEMQNAKQKFYTEALLDVMDRGLTLEISEQDIYAVRLCQCKVYWSGPGVSEHGPPNPMERERKIKVFSLNQFLDGLIMFHKGAAPSPPPFEVYFCFGEDWPDTKPKEKKLIVVQVVPVVARILTEMFSGELSWSMDSIRLQISNPDVKDQTVEKFKELQRLLQSQHAQGQWGLHVQ
ncbi:unnamed protein product [Merluccius merluccius]